MNNKLGILGFILIALGPGLMAGGRGDKPLACLSLINSDDSFSTRIAGTFERTMVDTYGYRTQINYCHNSLETQFKQIENFISIGAELILVHCLGHGGDYGELFQKAADEGCLVIAVASDPIEKSTVQSVSNSFLKGVAKCELVKEFLDDQYPDAPPRSVTVLILDRLSTTGFIKTCAGMRLLGEKYLRYFDYKKLEYIRYPGRESVFYEDGYGNVLPVEEPAGGLILDERGMAILNPCYDPRVRLIGSTNKDIRTILDGQSAINSLMATPEGDRVRIVISHSGDAAVGADQRMLYFYERGMLGDSAEQLAVFGSDDTEVNRELMEKSANGESLLKGYVGYRSIEWEIQKLIEMAMVNPEKKTLELEVLKARLNRENRGIEVEFNTYSFWKQYDFFRDWE